MAAFSTFFVAVLLVILATYLLFICGSVALCKILQKNNATIISCGILFPFLL